MSSLIILENAVTLPFVIIFYLLQINPNTIRNILVSLFIVLGGYLLTLGLISVTLLPQLEWLPHTTRSLLLEHPDVYPKWNSKKEILTNTFLPGINNNNLSDIDTEKWVVIGTSLFITATIGFCYLKLKYQFIILIISSIILLIALNNASPFYSILLQFDWFKLLRVSTRVWIIPVITMTFLAGFGFEILYRQKRFKLILILFTIVLLELTTLSYLKINQPIISADTAPNNIYTYLGKDKTQFRVFCTNRCLSQKKAAEYNIQTIEGYNTLIQENYYRQSLQFTQKYWNYYSLSIPPIGIAKLETITPDVSSLAQYNVKYVISPYLQTNGKLIFKNKIDQYFIYEVKDFYSRAYFINNDSTLGPTAPVLYYSPNKITIDTTLQKSSGLILADIYSPGWKAFLNGKEEAAIQERPNILRLISINPDTSFVEFRYQPQSFKTGSIISGITLIIIILLIFGEKSRLINRTIIFVSKLYHSKNQI